MAPEPTPSPLTTDPPQQIEVVEPTTPGTDAAKKPILAAMEESRRRREALEAEQAAAGRAAVEDGSDTNAVAIRTDWRPQHPDVWFGPHQKPVAPHVDALRKLLTDQGYYDPDAEHGDLDGVFGPMTQSAVERFQQAADLDENGYVDQMTWDALYIGAGYDPAEPARD